jgi:hypothetical protein
MRQSLTREVRAVIVLMTAVCAAACGSSPSSGGSDGSPGAAPASAKAAAVKTAAIPADACGWIPAAEVEAVVGKLSGPPQPAGNDCVYPLAAKSETFARLLEARTKFRRGDPGKHDFRDEVRVTVSLDGSSNAMDIANAAVGQIFAKELGVSPSEMAKKDPPPPGWDWEGGLPYSWIGRVGHISISVFSPPEITKETKMALAAKVRDRIPDLPFPADNTYQVITLGGDRNPCELLTRAEAEGVLGKLIVDPYRSIEYTSHAYEKGKGCAYYTAGHRAFVITAEWQDGAMTFNLSRGIGGLIGAVAPLERASLEGPWDKGQVDGTSGALIFLKGDRYMRVDYLTSPADRDGALALSKIAMQRLGS